MRHDEDDHARPARHWPADDPDTTGPPPDTAAEVEPVSLPNLIGHGGHLAPIPGGRRRQLLLRFTAAELAEVTGRAADYGLAPAAFAHITARFFEPTAPALRRLRPPMSRQDAVALAADLVPLRRTLSGIGTNLNQLARAANAGDQVSAAQLAAAVEYLAHVLARVEDWLDRVDPDRVVHRRGAR
ncbi:MobC family plasmid mobilization relaxosome protein [Actinosynnema sp. NPDC059335]|uniref:MobC family plasmid mobilization relaxosome protein n=1 Tax=Actinosynnema sp. NPDC059335 TaxID=3346804 RepID=UPI0036721BD0